MSSIPNIDQKILDIYTDYLVDKIDNKDEKIAIILLKIDKFVDELLLQHPKNEVYDALILYTSAIVVKVIEQIKNDIQKFNRDLVHWW